MMLNLWEAIVLIVNEKTFCGAGGFRTRVQTVDREAFYMLSFLLVFEYIMEEI